jgi:hypothetical protein
MERPGDEPEALATVLPTVANASGSLETLLGFEDFSCSAGISLNSEPVSFSSPC